MSATFFRLNTAFVLPEEVGEKVIVLSKKIGVKYDTFFTIDGIRLYPHITIYAPEYPEYNIEKILRACEEIADGTPHFTLRFKGVGGDQGFVGIRFENSLDVKKFQEEIITRLNPFREEGRREKRGEGSDYHVKFSLDEKRSIKEYGFPKSMDLYSPHMTISRLKDESLGNAAIEAIRWDIPQFTLEKIAVYKTGDHGTCVELIKEFVLRGA